MVVSPPCIQGTELMSLDSHRKCFTQEPSLAQDMLLFVLFHLFKNQPGLPSTPSLSNPGGRKVFSAGLQEWGMVSGKGYLANTPVSCLPTLERRGRGIQVAQGGELLVTTSYSLWKLSGPSVVPPLGWIPS